MRNAILSVLAALCASCAFAQPIAVDSIDGRAAPELVIITQYTAEGTHYEFVECASTTELEALPESTTAVRARLTTSRDMDAIAKLKSLEALDLTGSSPESLKLLKTMKKLKFFRAGFTPLPTDDQVRNVARHSSLEELHLFGWEPSTQAAVDDIFALKKLEWLSINLAQHDPWMVGISKCKKLRGLALRARNVRIDTGYGTASPAVVELTKLKKLEALSIPIDYSRTADNKLLAEYLQGLPNLTRLQVGSGAGGLGSIKLRKLRELSSDADLRYPWDLPSLEVFTGMCHAEWSDTFKTCKGLRVLSLFNTPGKGSNVMDVVDTDSLETFLYTIEVDPEDKGALRCIDAPNLRHLKLGEVDASLVKRLGKSGKLETLRYSVSIPRGFGYGKPWKGAICAGESKYTLKWLELRTLAHSLDATLLTELSELSNLEHLKVDSHTLTADPAPLGKLARLQHLELECMDWSGIVSSKAPPGESPAAPFPADAWENLLPKLPELKLLMINAVYAQPATAVLQAIGTLKKLERLELNFADSVAATDVAALGELTELRRLDFGIQSVSLDKAAVVALGKLPHLGFLKVYAAIESEDAAAAMSQWTALTTLWLNVRKSETELSDKGCLTAISKLPSLQKLGYSSQTVKAADMEPLRNAPCLWSLSCSNPNDPDLHAEVQKLMKDLQARFK